MYVVLSTYPILGFAIMETPSQDPIIELLTNYHELNSPTITELLSVPSALEFMRYVALNRPFVVRGGASDWEATRTWNVGTLKDLLEGQKVNVAVTAEGYVLGNKAG
jgi:peptidyl-lysine (3S)-dioxygenase / protease